MLSCARTLLATTIVLLAGCSGGGDDPPVPPSLIDLPASVLDGKVIANYQGWFGCPGDYEGNVSWIHWFYGGASVDRLTVDMLPDVSQLPASSLCDTGLPLANGDTLKVFTSMDPDLVDLHFKQMSENGVGAVNVQRFVNEISVEHLKRRRDRVLENALAAAQRHQLPLYITYDVSGANPGTVMDTIRTDWAELNAKYDFAQHPIYLRDAGRPVLQLWGFGFEDRPGDPDDVLELQANLKNGIGAPAAFLIGGVPSRWNTLSGDSKWDPRWAKVYGRYDVISPWVVGRYASGDEASSYINGRQFTQMALAAANGQGFLPVVFPGFSWRNLSANAPYMDGKPTGPLNQIPRDCGRFFERQVHEVKGAGARSVQVAMFDEVDEATAMLPTLPTQVGVPVGAVMVGLDQDGCTLASDHYLRALKGAAAVMR